ERHVPRRRLQSDRLVVVLDDHRDAVQRADELVRRGEPLVERVGDLERSRIDDGDRVDRWTSLVVGRDPLQIGVDQRVAGEGAGAHRGVNGHDARFVDLERSLGARRSEGGAKEREQREAGSEHWQGGWSCWIVPPFTNPSQPRAVRIHAPDESYWEETRPL